MANLLKPLKGLTALTSLNLSGTQVVNLEEPLKGLIALTSLDLADTQVVSLVPLQDLPRVQFAFGVVPASVGDEELQPLAAYRASKGLPPAF